MTPIRYGIALLPGVAAGALAAPVVDRTAPSPVTNVSREQLESLPTGRSVEDLLRTCPASTIPTATSKPQILIDGRTTAPGNPIDCVKPDDLRMIEVYKLHNAARFEVGSRPLVWDPLLAAQAASYGPELAQYGRPVHSSRVGRETSRENLLQALPGTSAGAMVGVWTAEKRNFVNGIFPNVSLTGNWADVGHYSQMIWPTTTNLGCAIHTGGQFDWLICRYSPPGNKDGKMVLAEREKEPPLPPTTGGRILHPSGIPQPQKAPYDPCSPAAMAAADVQIPWNKDAPKGLDDYYQVPDHKSVKSEYDGTRQSAKANTPPPESILDDVGENSAGPPPESILDDVGATNDARSQPPPPPKTEKGKAVHDTPMAQPRGASTPPPESILDDVGQDDRCKPALSQASAGIVGQAKLQDLSWLDLPDRLDEWVFQADWGYKAAEKACDPTAIANFEAYLKLFEEQVDGAAKLISPARAAGEFSTVDADHLSRSVDYSRKFLGETRPKLEQLRQRCAAGR